MWNISNSVASLILALTPFLLICIIFLAPVNCAPLILPDPDRHDLQTNLVEVELGTTEQNAGSTVEESTTPKKIRNTSESPTTYVDREEYLEDIDSEPQDFVNTTPQLSPLKKSMNNLFNSMTGNFRRILTTGQHGLLRAIGSVDKTVADVQTALENSTYSMILEGQKAAARVYEETPQLHSVNRLLQRVGTVRDNRMLNQLSDVINQWRDNRKKLFDMLHQHENNFHHVFQNAFATANKHLGVQELPRIQMGWY